MDLLLEVADQLPSALKTKVWELTETLPVTTSVSSTIAQNYEQITSVIDKAHANQASALSALTVVTNSVSSFSLLNDIIQAQATLNYYEILQSVVTANSTVDGALLTQAAQASQIMLNMFNDDAFYSGNYPSLGGNTALLVVYSIFFVLQIISGVFYHQWWFLTCWSCALILEILGFAGRIWSSQNIMNFNAFVLQLVCLTLAPCFMMAGIYYVIAQLTLIYGRKFSLLRPMQYSLIFILCDIISIVLQALGGGMAAYSLSIFESSKSGTHIMVAGLAYQVFTIAVFQLFWYIFLFQVWKSYRKYGDAEFNPKFAHIRQRKWLIYFIVAVSFAVVLIFVRSIYRLIELAEGWSSTLATDEIYFMILEALMVSLASCVLSFMPPGLAYGRGSHLYIDKSLKTTFARKIHLNNDHNDQDDIYRDGEERELEDTDNITDNLDVETKEHETDAGYFNNSDKQVI